MLLVIFIIITLFILWTMLRCASIADQNMCDKNEESKQ